MSLYYHNTLSLPFPPPHQHKENSEHFHNENSLICLWLPMDLQPVHPFSIDFFCHFSSFPFQTPDISFKKNHINNQSHFFTFITPSYKIITFFLFYKKNFFDPTNSLKNFKKSLNRLSLLTLQKQNFFENILIPSIDNIPEPFNQEEINDHLIECFSNHFNTKVQVFLNYRFL